MGKVFTIPPFFLAVWETSKGRIPTLQPKRSPAVRQSPPCDILKHWHAQTYHKHHNMERVPKPWISPSDIPFSCEDGLHRTSFIKRSAAIRTSKPVPGPCGAEPDDSIPQRFHEKGMGYNWFHHLFQPLGSGVPVRINHVDHFFHPVKWDVESVWNREI